MTDRDILRLAADLLAECVTLETHCQNEKIKLPTLRAGKRTEFWSDTSVELTATRSRALGILDQLQTLLLGPHDFLHEFVASNWDHGAVYAVMQFPILENIAATPGGRVSLTHLAEVSEIPTDKLARVLRLLCCRHFIDEPVNGEFSLTAVSEELLRDVDFRSWVEFQLFETRVASAHLAQALSVKPNSYSKGTSGFKQGWGMEMYDWHVSNPEKGDRFRRAMKGVSSSLDPADFLIRNWIEENHHLPERVKVVELGGRYGFASTSLVAEYLEFNFEVRCESQDFLDRGQAQISPDCWPRITFKKVSSLSTVPSDDSDVVVYIIRNLLWNWTDDDAIQLLRSLLPALKKSTPTYILVTDGVSPGHKEFPPHVEIGYRRRDITTMTMHNVKQRSQFEWLEMFSKVDPGMKVTTRIEKSSHVCKGLWELKLAYLDML